MKNLTELLYCIDQVFTTLIFIPAIFILYCKFSSFLDTRPKARNIYRLCRILIILFLLRVFCAKFIFTDINYARFTDSGLFPLIKAVFYPQYR